MKNNKTLKYRTIALALSLLYINFFIFSSFHQHHSDENNCQAESEVVNFDLELDCCDINDLQHLNNHSHHSHNFEICLINNVFSKQNHKLFSKIDSYSAFDYTVENDNKNKNNNSLGKSIPNYYWSKIVQTTTNVSPPFA